jgi:hypothetical protein
MIKMRPLTEGGKYGDWPNPLLKDYLLKNAVVSLSDYLYHGTPFDGLVSMLVRGIHGTQHGEVAEYDSFSTSLNSEMLHYFSEGNGETGLQFKVENIKVIVLDDMMSFLVTQLPGSGVGLEVDDEAKFEEFCEKFDIPIGTHKHVPCLPYDYLSSLGVDAFMFDYVWRRYSSGHVSGNDESEVCFIGKSIDKLSNMISGIWVDGEEFEKKLPALRAIKRKMRDKA